MEDFQYSEGLHVYVTDQHTSNTDYWMNSTKTCFSLCLGWWFTGPHVCLNIQISAAKRYRYCSLLTRWICGMPCLLSRSHRCWVWRTSKTNLGTSGKISVKQAAHYQSTAIFSSLFLVVLWSHMQSHKDAVTFVWSHYCTIFTLMKSLRAKAENVYHLQRHCWVNAREGSSLGLNWLNWAKPCQLPIRNILCFQSYSLKS